MKKIYMVRHGQTYLNKYRRLQGWSDAPLTESGIAEAHRIGQTFKNILLVCHACSIHCLATLLAKDGQKIPGRLPSHTEMTVLNVDDDGQVSLEEFGREV